MKIINTLGGRKVVFGIVCLIALVSTLLASIDPANYSTFCYALIGLYASMTTGNASEHIAEAFKSRAASKPTLGSESRDSSDSSDSPYDGFEVNGGV